MKKLKHTVLKFLIIHLKKAVYNKTTSFKFSFDLGLHQYALEFYLIFVQNNIIR